MSRKKAIHERYYTVILEREDDGGYHAFCPSLPGCHTQGDTYDEAVKNAEDAVQLYLESLQAHGEALPIEDIISKRLFISNINGVNQVAKAVDSFPATRIHVPIQK
jgi:predicted RNase H-like HicB family nuclease